MIELEWPKEKPKLPRGYTLDPWAVARWLDERFGVEIGDVDAHFVIYFAQSVDFDANVFLDQLDLDRKAPVCVESLDRAVDESYWHIDPRAVFAALLCVGLADETIRERLRYVRWRTISRSLDAQRTAPPPPDLRPGWLTLKLNTAEGCPTVMYRVEAKRGRKMLNLRRVRQDRAIEEVLREPSLFEQQAWQWQQALVLQEGNRRGSNDRLAGRLMDSAPKFREILLDDVPVPVDSTPWAPTITLTDRVKGRRRTQGKGSVFFTVGPRPEKMYRLGRGWVVLDGVLRPMDPGTASVLEYLRSGDSATTEISAAHVSELLETVLSRVELPVVIETERLVVEALSPQPRLLVSTEAFETIVVDVHFRYGKLDLTPEHGTILAMPDGLVRRDLVLEGTLRRELGRAVRAARLEGEDGVEAEWPARLFDDAAWRFLRDLPERFPTWLVEADKALMRRLRGKAKPRVTVSSDADWFDINLGMQINGEDLGLRRVLEAWRAQRQFVALKSGQVVELPELWLEKHGSALEAIEDLRLATGKRLGAPAALLAADLLAEADPESARAAARWLAVAENLRGVDRVPERAVPAGLTATLRDYQHRGFRWLCFLRELGLGGVLADDMGLGKTVQTLALLLDGRAYATAPDLVVAPTSVVHNWVLEARKFTPGLKVHLHHGPKRGEVPEGVDLVVTSYALLRIDRARLAGPWHTVVLDEAQNIKNHLSAVSKAARALEADYRFALTGTPMENHLLELWSIMGFVAPGLFGTREGFSRRFAGPIANGGELAKVRLKELSGRMRPFILRRLKAEVATELPPRQEQVLHVELGPRQRRFYDNIRDAYRAEVEDLIEAKGIAKSKIKVLEALLRLRQAACEPALIPLADARAVGESAKRETLRQMLPVLADDGHRSLVFSQWPGFLKLIGKDLDAMGLSYLYLDGSTRHRGGLQARWNDPAGPPFFLISIKAGGTGLNLVAADHVIHLDPWWNPAVEQQATDRAHRIGQTRPVLVYKLVAQDTVEEKIVELQERKRALFNATVDADRVGVDQLSGSDLEFVFGSLGASPTPALGSEKPAAVVLRLVEPVEPVEPVAPVAPAEPPVEGEADSEFNRVIAAGTPVTNAQVRQVLGLGAAKARKRLADWVAAGLLKKTGAGRGTRYLPE